MKKVTKALLAIGAIIATPVIINHVIAKKAEKRIGEKVLENVYNWEYGDIHYEVAGEGAPLLLIHGIYPGASNQEWKKLMSLFAENHKVYAIDLLGFGHSSKPALDYSAYLYVRLIKDFIENVIGQPTTAVASLHSAMALATCAALNPEDFEKLLLVSPTGLETETLMAQNDDGMAKKVLESPILGTSIYNALCSKKGLAEFFKESGIVAEGFDEQELDKIYLAAHTDGAAGKYAVAALLTKFLNADIKTTLGQLAVPFNIIAGECSSADSDFNLWQDIGTDYPAIIMEGHGLLPHIENPEEFYAAAKEFL